jgi:hypothetical protein
MLESDISTIGNDGGEDDIEDGLDNGAFEFSFIFFCNIQTAIKKLEFE